MDRVGARTTAIAAGAVAGVSLSAVPAVLAAGGDAETTGFVVLVVLWSVAVAAQAPAVQACAQRIAPPGAEAEALALPRATGDGVYIVAPFVLGVVTDLVGLPGVECAVAGAASLLGVLALAALGPAAAKAE